MGRVLKAIPYEVGRIPYAETKRRSGKAVVKVFSIYRNT